jgi:hypothetical protein
VVNCKHEATVIFTVNYLGQPVFHSPVHAQSTQTGNFYYI